MEQVKIHTKKKIFWTRVKVHYYDLTLSAASWTRRLAISS